MLYALLGVALLAVVLDGRRHWRRRTFRLRRRPTGRRPEDNFTTDQRAEIFERSGGRCAHCGVWLHYKSKCGWVNGCNHDFHADHITPVVDGGLTIVENGQALCRYHNTRKGRRHNEEYIAAERGRR
jgi:hypothetical protein